jgi:4a-hydroxytetrahydrobiopterin dehydratase
MSDARLTDEQITAADLADWRAIKGVLLTRFRTGDFATGLRLVNEIGAAAEAANHHPDVELRYPNVTVKLVSHDAAGITQRDLDLAARISDLAAELGVAAEPTAVSVMEVALDTPDFEKVKPFWRAVLGYTDNPESPDELRNDGSGQPVIWFQESGSDEPRQRFHIDINVPKEIARQRIDETVAAGGKLVDEARTFTVLEDADGNKACVCFG